MFTVNTIILSFHCCSTTPCHSISIKCNIEPHGEYVMNSFKNLYTTNHQFRNKAMTECTLACRVGLGYQTWSTGASGLHNEWPSVCISLSQAVIIMRLLCPAVIALKTWVRTLTLAGRCSVRQKTAAVLPDYR